MTHSRVVAVALALTSAVCATRSVAQTLPQPAPTVGAELRSLAARAHDVFVGQVVSIERTGGVVAVTFRLDQSLAGTASATYTLREWAGLWPPGEQRYFLGERAMVFVHGASSAGLSSPVDGPDGVIPVLVSPNAAGMQLDVRRLDARVLRAPNAPLPSDDAAAISLSDGVALVLGCRRPLAAEPVRHALPVQFRAAAPVHIAGRLVDPQPPLLGEPHVEWQPEPAALTEQTDAR